jgi:hypothetical protein
MYDVTQDGNIRNNLHGKLKCCIESVFFSLSQIFPDWYHFEHNKVAKRSLDPSLRHHENLVQEAQVRRRTIFGCVTV